MNEKQLEFVKSFSEALTKMRIRIVSEECASGCHKFLLAVDKKFKAVVVDPVQTPDQLLEALSKHFAVGAEFYRETLAELADSPEVEPTKQSEEKPDQSEDSLDDMPKALRELVKKLNGINGISVEVVSVKKKPE